eukprot:COSAG04_NODE_793_length_10270_cov_26.952807_3_plen_253_part_00
MNGLHDCMTKEAGQPRNQLGQRAQVCTGGGFGIMMAMVPFIRPHSKYQKRTGPLYQPTPAPQSSTQAHQDGRDRPWHSLRKFEEIPLRKFPQRGCRNGARFGQVHKKKKFYNRLHLSFCPFPFSLTQFCPVILRAPLVVPLPGRIGVLPPLLPPGRAPALALLDAPLLITPVLRHRRQAEQEGRRCGIARAPSPSLASSHTPRPVPSRANSVPIPSCVVRPAPPPSLTRRLRPLPWPQPPAGLVRLELYVRP